MVCNYSGDLLVKGNVGMVDPPRVRVLQSQREGEWQLHKAKCFKVYMFSHQRGEELNGIGIVLG